MAGPAVLTYASLKTDMEKYLERGESEVSDPTYHNQIPRLIMLAQKQIIQDLKIEGFKEVVLGTMSGGSPVYAKPDRWRETISLNFKNLDPSITVTVLGDENSVIITTSDGDYIGTQTEGFFFTQGTPLYQRDYTYIQLLSPDRDVVGKPKYYAEYDASNILISPTPDLNYPFEWSFYAIPPLLSDDQQTNWATDIVPNLLLYQCLLQASTFLKNDERVPIWQGQYQSTIQALTVEDIRKIGDGSDQRRGA